MSTHKINTSDNTLAGSLNITNAFSQRANIFVKNYGAASSSTLSIRGGTANQALITWHELPINNPMLGLSDLSLIPSLLFNQLKVMKGGSSATAGNGAITGVIDIADNNNRTDKAIDLDVNFGLGSHGLRQAGIKAITNYKQLQSVTNLYTAASTNDFNYILDSGQIKQNTHAQFKTSAWLQSLSYQLKPNQNIMLQSWLQNTERQIPPTTTQNRSEAVQDDLTKRFRLTYKYNGSRSSLESQLAYFDENNIYEDPQNLIYNDNAFKRLIHKSKYSIVLPNDYILSTHAEVIHTRGSSESYEDIETLTNYAITIGTHKNWKRKYIDLTMRYERNSLDKAFFSPALVYNHHFSQELSVQAKFSREYRFPTLNELYWRPGGNTELLSEHGWNQELNFSYEKPNIGLLQLNFYHRLMNDWILWSLIDNTNFFAPYNISKVRSYGTEFNFNKRLNFKSWALELDVAYNYTVSENQNDISLPKINAGDQLFYIPKHQSSLGLKCHYKKIKFNINGQYTSSTLGTLDILGAYTLINSSIEYGLNIKGQEINISAVLSNITNTNYRIIERRPMMGRNYNLNINYKL